MRILLVPALLLTSLSLSACGDSERERCAQCGMYVDLAPRWMAERRGETPSRYDTPKCAFRAAGADGLHLREYYSQQVRPVAELVFVVGSDVLGPMGDDLVPLDPAQVDHFIEDHGGRRVDVADVDAALLLGLDPG